MNAQEAYNLSKKRISDLSDTVNYQFVIDNNIRPKIKEAAENGEFNVTISDKEFLCFSFGNDVSSSIKTYSVNSKILSKILENLGYKVSCLYSGNLFEISWDHFSNDEKLVK